MAASADRSTPTRHPKVCEIVYPVATAVTIYKGTLVMLVAGYLTPAADTAGGKVVGVAMEKVVNAGADGAKTCRVGSGAAFLFTGSSIVAADVGKPAFVTDDSGIQDAANTNYVIAGIIEEVAATDSIWVYIPPAGLGSGGGGLRVWTSAEITGSGAEQTNAHTLGAVPVGVTITVTELPDAAAETGFDVAYGTHTSAAVLCTVTNTVKYRITAFAVG